MKTMTRRSVLLAAGGQALLGGAAARAQVPTKGPTVTPQMFGARGDGVADDRGAIQAAIDHLGAMGGGTVFFPSGIYKVVAPERVSNPADRHQSNGHHLVLTRGGVTLDGAGRKASRLVFRAMGDHSHGAHWQTVAGRLWRGGGLFIRGGKDAAGAITGIRIANLGMDGGADYTAVTRWPASPVSGQGWDLTHRCIHIEEDRFVGEVTVQSCELQRWRGEIVFQGGANGERLNVVDCDIHDGNADGISSSMGNHVDSCRIRNIAFAGIECGYYGQESIYSNLDIRDIGGEGVSLVCVVGPWPPGRQLLSGIRIANAKKAIIGFRLKNAVISDIDIVDCGWTGGGFRALQIYDDAKSPCADVDVHDVRFHIDARNLNAAVGLIRTGPRPWRNVRLSRLSLDRTAAARAAGYTVGQLVEEGCRDCDSPLATVSWSHVEPGAVRAGAG